MGLASNLIADTYSVSFIALHFLSLPSLFATEVVMFLNVCFICLSVSVIIPIIKYLTLNVHLKTDLST